MDITKLQTHLPIGIYNQIPGILTKFSIDGPLRLSNLLGQCRHESGGFKVFVENLNYSGEALYKLFKKYFKDQEEANSFARQPERIANRIYSNRMGNGIPESGEGWKFRGRGCLQTTGKNNYIALGNFLGVDLITTPDQVATDYCLSSAAFFFLNNNLWTICDQGMSDEVITKVSKRVNGGVIGLSERIKHTKEYYHILTS